MGKVRRRSDGAKSFDECELRRMADAEIRCERGDEDGSRWRGKVREVGVRVLCLAANRLIQHGLADAPGMPGDAPDGLGPSSFSNPKSSGGHRSRSPDARFSSPAYWKPSR